MGAGLSMRLSSSLSLKFSYILALRQHALLRRGASDTWFNDELSSLARSVPPPDEPICGNRSLLLLDRLNGKEVMGGGWRGGVLFLITS